MGNILNVLIFLICLLKVLPAFADDVFIVPQAAKRIGIYTGTFDPPHLGHLEVVMKAKKDLGLDLIYVIPNVDTPHKPNANPFKLRREMAVKTFQGEGIIVGDEVVTKIIREGSVNTFTKNVIDGMAPEATVFKLVGDDSMVSFKKFKDAYTDERMVFAVAPRKDSGIEIPEKIGESKVIKLEVPETGYSSTLVRKTLATGKKPDFINEEVYNFIVRNELYGTGPCLLFQLNQLMRAPIYP